MDCPRVQVGCQGSKNDGDWWIVRVCVPSPAILSSLFAGVFTKFMMLVSITDETYRIRYNMSYL